MHPDDSDANLPSAPYQAFPVHRHTFSGPRGASLHAVCRAILVVELAERTCYFALAGSQEFFLERLGAGAQESAGINAAFTTLCYMWPLAGGYVADTLLGRYWTILGFSLVYLAGVLTCAVVAMPSLQDKSSYLMGMFLVAIGTGGIKPNISNFGADQFDSRSPEGRKAREEFYTHFYMSINLGVLVSYGFLTTLCSSGLPPYLPARYGYAAAYSIACLAMLVALVVFLGYSNCYRCLHRHMGDALRGVALHVVSAAVGGSWHARCICIGCPLLFLGLLLSVAIALLPKTAGLGLFGASAVLLGLLLATYGCGNTKWVHLAQRNSHVTRQQTADFLRVMPTLAAVNLAFNSLYNCSAFWFQEQACLMDVRLHGPLQLNGSFFNVADGLAIVLFTPLLLNHVNPFLERRLRLGRNGKLLLGCGLGSLSLLWAAQLEAVRRVAPLLPESSLCAPDGNHMSSLSAWWMVGPYAVMGVAEVYVNPTLYYLAYSQSPLRLRSSAQAVGLLMSATSSALFTILTAILDSHNLELEVGYYASLAMMVPFLCWYLAVQSGWEERHFDEEAESEPEVPCQLNKPVAYSRTGMLRDFASPQSVGGSPASWVDHSPLSSEASAAQNFGDNESEAPGEPCDFVLVSG